MADQEMQAELERLRAENERLLAEYIPLGIEVSRELFRSLARL